MLYAWYLVYISAYLGKQPKYPLHFSLAGSQTIIPYHCILFLSHFCHPIYSHGPNLQLFGVCRMQIKLILDTQGQLTQLLAVLSSPPPVNSSLLLTSDILSSPLGSTQVEGKLAHCLSLAVNQFSGVLTGEIVGKQFEACKLPFCLRICCNPIAYIMY